MIKGRIQHSYYFQFLKAAFDTDVNLTPGTNQNTRTQIRLGLARIRMQPGADVNFIKEIFGRYKSRPALSHFITEAGIDNAVSWNGSRISTIKGLFDILKVRKRLVYKA